jgi:hypothetical protein
VARIVTHVRLVKGTSNTRLLRFTSDHPPGLVSIGGEVGAAWIVSGAGVLGNHLELFWDGQAIWITESHQGEVVVEGDVLEHKPRRVYRGRVNFGECTLVIDTIFAAEVKPMSLAQFEALREELGVVMQSVDDRWEDSALRAS